MVRRKNLLLDLKTHLKTLVEAHAPSGHEGPIREIIPVPSQRVHIPVPAGKRVAAVRLLVAGRSVPYKETNGAIELETPPIGLHEVVAHDFAG